MIRCNGVFAFNGSRIPSSIELQQSQRSIQAREQVLSDRRLLIRTDAESIPWFYCPITQGLACVVGELSNQAELRARLPLDMSAPTGQSELVWRLYQARGLLMLPLLRGAFTLVIWDPRVQRFILATDPLGLRQAYMHRDGDQCWFANDFESLITHANHDCGLNLTALHHFLSLGATPPNQSLINGIEVINPGELVVIQRGKLRRSTYWQPVFTHLQAEHPTPQSMSSHLAVANHFASASDFGLSRALPIQSRAHLLHGSKADLTTLGTALPVYLQSKLAIAPSASLLSSESIEQAFRSGPLAGIEALQAVSALCELPQASHGISLFGYRQWFSGHNRCALPGLPQGQSNKACDPYGVLQTLHALKPYLEHREAMTQLLLRAEFVESLNAHSFDMSDNLPLEWSEWHRVEQSQYLAHRLQVQPVLPLLTVVSAQRQLAIHYGFLDCDFLEFCLDQPSPSHLRGIRGQQWLGAQEVSLIKRKHANAPLLVTQPNALQQQGLLSPVRLAELQPCLQWLEREGSRFDWLDSAKIKRVINRANGKGARLSRFEQDGLIRLTSVFCWFDSMTTLAKQSAATV